MGYHGYLTGEKEDLNLPLSYRNTKERCFQKSDIFGPSKRQQSKGRRKVKWNLGKFLGFLAARTQQGMTLLNGLLLLIIFLIFPSW